MEMVGSDSDALVSEPRLRTPRRLVVPALAFIAGAACAALLMSVHQKPNSTGDLRGVSVKSAGGVTLWLSTATSNRDIKKHQQQIQMILDGNKIDYVTVDLYR